MKKYILIGLVVGLIFVSCNPNQKEIGEVESLLALIEDSEKSLLSVDTSLVFEVKRQMDQDIFSINTSGDTLTRKDAFKLDDVFGSKKRLHTIMRNYPGFLHQIEFSKKQLNNLKKDLEKGLVTKEDFTSYYKAEQNEVMELNSQISKALAGLDLSVIKFKKDRPIVLEILKKRKLNTATNE